MPPNQTDFDHTPIDPVRLGRTRGTQPSMHGKVYGDLDNRTRALEKRVDGEWVYIGTYPGDDLTTPDSPPFRNNWENVGDGKLPLRYRWTLSGKVEIEGVITGDTVGKVVFKLPRRLWPDEEYKVPFAADDSSPATLCVETDGDVVFCAKASTGGAAGDPLATLIDFGSLIGWWRLGESAPGGNVDNMPNGFEFEQEGWPVAPAGPLVVTEGFGSGGSHYLLRTNGNGPRVFGDFDDGALLMLQDGPLIRANMHAGAAQGYNFNDRHPYTYSFWFAPGYRKVSNPGDPIPNNAGGFLLGTSWTMDGSGSINIGEGFLWHPYGGALSYAHYGSTIPERTNIIYPILGINSYEPAGWNPNNAADPSSGWWNDNGFRDEIGALSGTFNDPLVSTYEEGGDNWWHIGLTYDGFRLRGYLNGTLFTSVLALAPTSLIGANMSMGRADMDFGVSAYYQGGDAAVDELIFFGKCLTPAQMGAVYRIGQGQIAGGTTTNANSIINNVSDALTSNTNIGIGETFVLCDSSSGAFTVYLPSASSMPGIAMVIKKLAGVNGVTIEGSGVEVIDGSLTLVLTAAYSSVTIISTGTQWLVID